MSDDATKLVSADEARAMQRTNDSGARRVEIARFCDTVIAQTAALTDAHRRDLQHQRDYARVTHERDEQRRRVRAALERLGVADCDDVCDALDEAADVERASREAVDEASALRVERDAAFTRGALTMRERVAVMIDMYAASCEGDADAAARAGEGVESREYRRAAVECRALATHTRATTVPTDEPSPREAPDAAR